MNVAPQPHMRSPLLNRLTRLLVLGLALLVLAACAPANAASPASTEMPTQPPAPIPSQTFTHEPTPTGTRTPKPSPTPDSRPLPEDWQAWPVVPYVSPNAIAIYRRGLEAGTDPAHFSKVGDCQNVSTYFLGMFDQPGKYTLGEEYEYLRPTIDHFAGSWNRTSAAVKGGFNVASVLSPLMVNKELCAPGETPLSCELRLHNPSIVIISMETWWSKKPGEEYEKYMRQILDQVIAHGAVPIIATKADNLEGDHRINGTIAKLAYEYDIPMWNFWAATDPLWRHGVSEDGFHLTVGHNDFNDRLAMRYGWPWRNLTALQAIDAVWNAVQE